MTCLIDLLNSYNYLNKPPTYLQAHTHSNLQLLKNLEIRSNMFIYVTTHTRKHINSISYKHCEYHWFDTLHVNPLAQTVGPFQSCPPH